MQTATPREQEHEQKGAVTTVPLLSSIQAQPDHAHMLRLCEVNETLVAQVPISLPRNKSKYRHRERHSCFLRNGLWVYFQICVRNALNPNGEHAQVSFPPGVRCAVTAVSVAWYLLCLAPMQFRTIQVQQYGYKSRRSRPANRSIDAHKNAKYPLSRLSRAASTY